MNLYHDPLGCELPLALQRSYYPQGVPLRLATNSGDILTVADRMWGRYPAASESSFSPAVLRVYVEKRCSAKCVSPSLPKGQGHLVAIVHGPDNFVMCDLSASFAFARLTQDVVRDRAYVRYHFLEPAVHMMIEAAHFLPVHASCVALNGRAVLLCGDSGAGKTSLAYACARQGWTYLADDATYVLRNQVEPTVAGRPFSIRFRSEAATLFPELSAYTPEKRPNGKVDLEIDTHDLGLTVALESRAGSVVFLNRKTCATKALLTSFPRAEALSRSSGTICYGDRRTRDEQTRALNGLLELPIVELAYSDFDGAEKALRELSANP